VTLPLSYPYLPGADVPGSFAEAVQKNLEDLALAGPVVTGMDFAGTGSPEGVVTAVVGSIYRRRDGGAGTSVYFKESGSGTNTGWVGK
jgi:hypothetical protein